MTPLEKRYASMDAFCRSYGSTLAKIMSKDAHRQISTIRNALYAELYSQGLPLRTIGRLVGRDHKAVSNGIKKHGRDQVNKKSRDVLEYISQK